MRIETLKGAILEAQRFIEKAKAAESRLETDKYASFIGSKETAAARRASMELTRALAKLRKP